MRAHQGAWAPYRFVLLSCLAGSLAGGMTLALGHAALVQAWIKSLAWLGNANLKDTYYVVTRPLANFTHDLALFSLYVLFPVSIGNAIVIGLASLDRRPGFYLFVGIYLAVTVLVLVASPLQIMMFSNDVAFYDGMLFVACGLATGLMIWLTSRNFLIMKT